MGSDVQLLAGDADEALLDWAMRELERLEHAWSRFRPDSDLAALHRDPGRWVDVGHALLLALTCAADLYRATDGAFDPTIRDALERAGYDRSFEDVEARVDDPGDLDAPGLPVAVPGFDAIEIDIERAAVRLPPGVRVDLGGVGKGLAADLVGRGLIERGARAAVVGLGGDLRVCGDAPPDGWSIPVVPGSEHVPAFHHRLVRGALVQSTTKLRRWSRRDRELHHIIDPARGEPSVSGVTTVVVAGDEAWWSEGIAKAVIVRGVAGARDLVQRAGVRAWVWSDDAPMVELGTVS
jgi:thiamine biosynthesis lipoprotein